MLACIKRDVGVLTATVSGAQNSGLLERKVRPEGQKGTPSIEDGRGPQNGRASSKESG